MTAWIKIGLRNIVKNLRRSVITALAIALGFAAVNLFAGFTNYMYTGNRDIAIYGKCGGHLTIFRKDFLEKGRLNPAQYLLSPEEIRDVNAICQDNPHVMLVTPQLRITGLASNGSISTIFIAQGIVPSAKRVFFSRMNAPKIGKIFEGRELENDKSYGVAMTKGLARLLDLKVGSYAVAFTNTIYGQMNALDMEVFQLLDAASDEMNDKIMQVPLAFARTLYDTDGADKLAILLDDTKYTESIRDQLQTAFSQRGLDLEAKTWEEMSEWYRKVKIMFDVIFAFLFSIVFIIVVMSVINTMSMVVVERTREIGTLRALGLRRRGVMSLFAVETSLLGVFGTIGGLFLTFIGWCAVDVIKPTWIPPGISRRMVISIEFVPEFMLYSFIFLILLCLIASLIPAKRAAGQNVVDALGHV
ncbi:MAG: ABC transporter permease [Desulfobacteraceae bacterium]|nr:ABC transporter permease [Desulfobacteraceae bacterium]MBC2718603.1 ABC transporter permease [Desulfobacteraceae bacterium]